MRFISEELLPCLCLSSEGIGISVHLNFLLQFHFLFFLQLELFKMNFFLITAITYITPIPPRRKPSGNTKKKMKSTHSLLPSNTHCEYVYSYGLYFLMYLHTYLCIYIHIHTHTHTDIYMCSIVSDSLQPMDCDPLGFSGHGIFQARTLEWVAISSSRGSS